MRRRAAPYIITLIAAAVVVLAGPATVSALTTLEGYTSLTADIRNSGGGDPSWAMDNPHLYAELMLLSTPVADLETYLKLWTESNRWVDDVPETWLFLREGHMRYRWEKAETHLFFGQNRF